MDEKLIVGIDISRNRADVCFLHPNGRKLERNWHCENSPQGYQFLSRKIVELQEGYGLCGVEIGVEATSYYWLPLYLEANQDVELQKHGTLRLYLLNPAWVRNYKKGIQHDHKNDAVDAYYIADRVRTHPPRYAWQPEMDWLPLRWYTRLRFHLVQMKTRLKNQMQVHLFLQHSAYNHVKPFSDTLSILSRTLIADPLLFSEFVKSPVEELAESLDRASNHALSDPLGNAKRLKQTAEESFRLPVPLDNAVTQILGLNLDLLDYFEERIEEVDHWIEYEIDSHHPEVRFLQTIPGIGAVFASGIAAEIGNLQRFLSGTKWCNRRKRDCTRNLRDAEDSVAKIAGLWWPDNASGNFVAEDTHLARTGNPYLRYYLAT